ncbi:MAG TPA: LuxR C-terminal-related transcriptional regulator [Gaiellaceae bacterium]|nr:LuxR C-terminal-related transcriptional regulator [Gaiellaceae bacterium]
MADVQAGWQALAAGRWEEALEHLRGGGDDPEALEGMGLAHWWLDDADATLATRERAFRLYREAGDPQGAARVASALAWDSLLFGGRAAVAQGWLERAARLLADEPVSAEHAWLAAREAEVALQTRTPDAARAAAIRAIELGAQVGSEEVQIAGRSLEGLALVQEGEVDEGMRRLDEAAVAATAGEVDDLMWIGKVCCNLITACERVGDVERATQWCDEVKEFAQRWELRTLFNVCRTQYASVLLQQGTWDEAERELTAAIDVLGRGRRASLVDGIARLGELRRRQGRLDEARSLFAQSELNSISRMGTVELALERDAAGALALAQRLERATDEQRRLSRIDVLLLLVRAAAAAGELAVAARAAAELESDARIVGTTGARAAAARAAGLVALVEGRLAAAKPRLEDAVDLYGHARAPYERAHARVDLARTLRALGEDEAAAAEAADARAAFQELSAEHDAATTDRLFAGQPANGPLTRRELEVIALVAAGQSNREIADRLVVSEHTVHRHVANILRELGEPTRAAAAARATRDGLV